MKAGVRALNRDQGSLAATQTQREWNVPALPNRANARRLKSLISFAGGEDYGYFASGAGDAGSNPAAGIYARVAELAKRLMFRGR